MKDTDKLFAGSIPDIYDAYLVPLIFQKFADDMAGRVASENPRRVLETAAGSGVVTRALAPLLAPDAAYSVTDLNQPMLDRAAKMQGVDGRIEWRQADAMSLPFGDAEFDAICCQFGVMFFPDRVAAYREARRALRPGGKFVFNSWDRIENNHFAHIVTGTAGEVFPDDPPLFLARTPHGYSDVARIRADVEAAGFSRVTIETIEEVSAAPSPRHPAIAYCQGTPLRNEIEVRDAGLLDHVTDRAAEAIEALFGSGGVAAKIKGHVVVASA